MRRTGVFYHDVVGRMAYASLAMSVEEGFRSVERSGLLSEPNVMLFESEPVSEELILKVHPASMVEEVKTTGYYETSLYSIGGVVQATERMLKGELDNALAFAGVGGHHAGRTTFWGGCFFNINAIAIEYARERLGARRFAIVDTDSHHADGTREIYQSDEDIMHLCYCWDSETQGTKMCFPHADSDDEFLERFEAEVPHRIQRFSPELVYWICGLDTHRDSYGTRKLTERCYPRLARVLQHITDASCKGRLLVMTGCNAPAHVSEYVMPRIVDVLSGRGRYTAD